MAILLQDLEFGILLLLKTPAFAVTAALSLASVPFSAAILQAQKVDTKAAAAAIMQADRDFNQSVASRDKKRFLSLISDGR